MSDQQPLTAAFSHMLWIVGSPCSDKSTLGHTIARIYVLLDYHLDPMERNHIARWLARGNTNFAAFLNRVWTTAGLSGR